MRCTVPRSLGTQEPGNASKNPSALLSRFFLCLCWLIHGLVASRPAFFSHPARPDHGRRVSHVRRGAAARCRPWHGGGGRFLKPTGTDVVSDSQPVHV